MGEESKQIEDILALLPEGWEAAECVAGDAGGEDAGNAAVAGIAVFSGPAGYSQVQPDDTCGVRRYEAEKAYATAPI